MWSGKANSKLTTGLCLDAQMRWAFLWRSCHFTKEDQGIITLEREGEMISCQFTIVNRQYRARTMDFKLIHEVGSSFGPPYQPSLIYLRSLDLRDTAMALRDACSWTIAIPPMGYEITFLCSLSRSINLHPCHLGILVSDGFIRDVKCDAVQITCTRQCTLSCLCHIIRNFWTDSPYLTHDAQLERNRLAKLVTNQACILDACSYGNIFRTKLQSTIRVSKRGRIRCVLLLSLVATHLSIKTGYI